MQKNDEGLHDRKPMSLGTNGNFGPKNLTTCSIGWIGWKVYLKNPKKGWPTIHIIQEVEPEPYIIVEQELNIIAREMDSFAWEMRWRRTRTRDVEGLD